MWCLGLILFHTPLHPCPTPLPSTVVPVYWSLWVSNLSQSLLPSVRFCKTQVCPGGGVRPVTGVASLCRPDSIPCEQLLQDKVRTALPDTSGVACVRRVHRHRPPLSVNRVVEMFTGRAILGPAPPGHVSRPSCRSKLDGPSTPSKGPGLRLPPQAPTGGGWRSGWRSGWNE